MSVSERIQASVRFRRGRYKALGEVAQLLGDISREDVVHLLLGRGLASLYAELGIIRDPAAHAAELLRAVRAQWDGDMSDDELAAIETAVKTMERIAQVRAREDREQETDRGR